MSKHRRTWDAIYASPTRANIPWKDIEAMMAYLGAEITEGPGSSVRVVLNGVRASFHRPHPERETDKGAVVSTRNFLDATGVDAP